MPSYTVHLDRRYQVTGSHSGGTTTYTLPFADPYMNCLVIGETHAHTGKFYVTSGTTATGSYGTCTRSSNTMTVAYDYTDIPCVIGCLYTMTGEPTQPFAVDQNGQPDFVARVQVHGLDVAYHLSGPFSVTHAMSGRTTRTREFAGNSDGTVTATGKYRALLNGNAKDSTWQITSFTPKRVVIPSIEFHSDANDRRKV